MTVQRVEIKTVDDARAWWHDVNVRVEDHGTDKTLPSIMGLAGQVILLSDPGTPVLSRKRDGVWLNVVWFWREGQCYRASYDHETGKAYITAVRGGTKLAA